MRTLYKLHFNCGRQGTLYGLFVEDSEKIDNIVERCDDINFGEALGKHSEICGPLEECDFTVISKDQKFIDKVIENKMIFGYNPMHYIY